RFPRFPELGASCAVKAVNGREWAVTGGNGRQRRFRCRFCLRCWLYSCLQQHAPRLCPAPTLRVLGHSVSLSNPSSRLGSANSPTAAANDTSALRCPPGFLCARNGVSPRSPSTSA